VFNHWTAVCSKFGTPRELDPIPSKNTGAFFSFEGVVDKIMLGKNPFLCKLQLALREHVVEVFGVSFDCNKFSDILFIPLFNFRRYLYFWMQL
jgi:hypothetical protein